MKTSRLETFRSLVKGVFRGKRKEAVAMETYLNCCGTIQKLIDTHKLGINLKERHVVLDIGLHMAFMPQGTSDADIRRSDKRYAAFFDKVLAFMNFQLGHMGKPAIDPEKEPLNFSVVMPVMRYFDDDMNPLPAHLQVEYRTICVGRYFNGEVDFKSTDL